MSRPDDIKYTKSHEWVRVDGNMVTVGITDFAVEALNDLDARVPSEHSRETDEIDHLAGRMYFDNLSRTKRAMLLKRARKGAA